MQKRYQNSIKTLLFKIKKPFKRRALTTLESAYFPLFTALANSLPALNFTTFLAGILISFPVCGLRPVRAFLLLTEKEPNPMSWILSPFFKALLIASMVASNAFAASAFVSFAPDAIASINPLFFLFL